MGGKTLTDARVPRQSEDELARDLAAFASEAAIGETSFKPEQANPLWEFPEEGAPSVAAPAVPPAVRKQPVYAWLAAVIMISTIAGAWWGGLIPRNRPLATDATVEPIVAAPVASLSADASIHSPAELIPSVEVRPSTQPPVAGIVPSVARDDGGNAAPPPKPVALAGAEPEQRQPTRRVTSMSRGTSGGVVTAPIPRLGTRPLTVPTPTPPTVAENPAAASAAPQPPPVADVSPLAAPPASRIPAPAVRPELTAVPPVVVRTEQSEIQRTLGQYRSAYQLLDAEAAQAVWPSVDVRALARAFDTLTSQQLAFETCEFDIAGAAATAQCRGSATYTPKVGNREPKLESRQWTFQLRKMGEDWKIQSAQTRR
jgi:hypothetical protein